MTSRNGVEPVGVIVLLTVAAVVLSFAALCAYAGKNIVRGRASGSGSVRMPSEIPAPSAHEPPRAFFQSIMPPPPPIVLRKQPALQIAPLPVVASPPAVAVQRAVAATVPEKKVTRIDRSKPTVFYTHKHLVPLVEKLAEEVWPTQREVAASYLKSLPYKDFSIEQTRSLKPHHASLRLYTVLDASFSVSAFRKEHRQFHELLYYHVMKNCGSRDLARKIAMGVRKYTRNSTLIFGGKNEKVVASQLSGVFWSEVFAEKTGFFEEETAKSFHFAFSMANDFTTHYGTVLGLMEKHCGVKLERPAFAIVLPPDTAKEKRARRPKKELVFSAEDGLYESVTGTYHDLLDWIEDSEQYKRLYEETMNQGLLDVCYFCGGDPDRAPAITLSNGWKVHERCYDMLGGRLTELRSVHGARTLFKTSPNLLSAFRLVNTYWPELPPDWDNRRETLFARADGQCENCGKPDPKLDVFHVRPVEKGGTHACDNLLCLCPACAAQLERHLASGSVDDWKSLYRQKLERVGEALLKERKLLFTYREEETRVIAPREWVKRRGYWLVRGYCYLHNDERLFNPRKMSDLRVL